MTVFTLVIRPEQLEACEGDHCAAAILNLFIAWTNGKKARREDLWIYKKQTELAADLMNLFGVNKVASALLKLKGWGYLARRENPYNRQDKTFQYQLDAVAVKEIFDILNQGLENAELTTQSLELKTGALEMRRDSVFESESLALSLSVLTPTPARAHEAVGGGVQGDLPEVVIVAPEQEQMRQDGSDLEDVDETRPTRTQNAHPPIAPPPFPDDTTEQWGTTEEETKSSPDTKPVDVPNFTRYELIFTVPDAEINRWLESDAERLDAWCLWAAAQDSVRSPGGFVRTVMRIGGHWPPVKQSRFYNPTGADYITGALADFIEH